MKRNLIVFFLIMLAVLAVIGNVFRPFQDQVQEYPTGLGDYPNQGTYRITIATILSDLENGRKDVFSPDPAPHEIYTSMFGEVPMPSWHQADYVKIDEALHEFVWKETLSNWRVERLLLDTSCRDHDIGFGDATFFYFRPIWMGGSLRYESREIQIRPLDGEVSWGGGARFPHPILGWRGLDLNKLKVTGEEALQIADAAGGKLARLSAADSCAIRMNLNRDAGWSIWYESGDGTLIYTAYIDPSTGKITKQSSAP
jgi:hypothetical protein